MEFNCLKTSEPLRENSLLFTTKSLEIAGTHLIGVTGKRTETNRGRGGPSMCVSSLS